MANLSFAQLESLWISNGGQQSLAPLMAAIALAESGGNPTALNPNDNGGRQSSFGLWQISNGTHTPPSTAWSDPNTNAQLAVAKERTQGLTAWGTYTNGSANRILAEQGGASQNLAALPATAGLTASGGSGTNTAATTDDEGYLFQLGGQSVAGVTVVPQVSMLNSTARKLVGGAVLVAGGLVALAGVAVLAGAGRRLPGIAQTPLRAVGGLRQRGVERRAQTAETATRTPPDELAARRRARTREQRSRAAEEDYRSAREAGARDAEAAGPF